MKTLRNIWILTRPAQQIKTGAVILGALGSGKVNSLESIGNLTILTILWVNISTCVYIFNDLSDLATDRLYPRNSLRPIAFGEISVKFAKATLFVLLFMSFEFTEVSTILLNKYRGSNFEEYIKLFYLMMIHVVLQSPILAQLT